MLNSRLRASVFLTLMFTEIVFADDTKTNDGRSDYRYANVNTGSTKEDYCKTFEPKFVADHKRDRRLKIHPGDGFSVFLRNAYFSKVKGFFSSTAEAAILMNADVNAPFIKKSASDYGKLIYYSDSIAKAAAVNASFVPALTVDTSATADVVSLDISVVQFESQNSLVARNILQSLVKLGTVYAAPQATAVLSAVGNSIANSQSNGVRTTQYRIGFIMAPPEISIRQPLLREGDFVLITSQDKEELINWPKLRFNHQDGLLYGDDNCDSKVTGLDYLVFTIRKSIVTGLDVARSQTLGDAIEAAKQRGLSATKISEEIAKTVHDGLSFEAAKDALKNYNQSVSVNTQGIYLRQVLTTLACGGNGNSDAECPQTKIDDLVLLNALKRFSIQSGMLCQSEIEKASAPLASGATLAQQISTSTALVIKRNKGDCPDS
jgi:hypothetical protein